MSGRGSALSARAALWLAVFVVFVAAATAGYVLREGIPPSKVAGAFAAFVILLVPYLGFGFPEVASAFRSLASRGPSAIGILIAGVAVPPAIVLFGARGAGAALPAAGLILYAAVPSLLLAWAGKFGDPPNGIDAAAVLAAWLPVEIGLLDGLWKVEGADPSYVLGKTLSVSALLVGLMAVRGLPGIGYRWRLHPEDFGVAVVATVVFLIVGLPFAIGTGLVEFQPRAVSLFGVLSRALAIGLLIALPEEILFRGVIFNLLQRATINRRGPLLALVLSAIIFGASHLNNFPYMDARYVLLATWAGLCYGWCYLRTGNLLGGILTHTAVDLIHRFVFVTNAPSS